MKKKLIQITTNHFKDFFHKTPEYIFLSPGRINIIGEHVDYNDGWVLPAAINRYICFAFSKTAHTTATFIARDLNETHTFDLKDDLKPIDKMWANYLLGIVQQIKEKGFLLQGFEMVFSSTIPMGAGLSSSAALECGMAYAMNQMFDLNLSQQEMALMGQKTEQTFVGVNCGIMDQFASVFGKKNQVIQLDCNTLEHLFHQADFKKHTLLLLDSLVKHTHLTSGYNVRRQEVEQGLSVIKEHFPEVKSFRNCTEQMIIELKEKLGAVLYKRCFFVVQEIQRVQKAVDALKQSDFKALGALMFDTHHGLSEQYQVSCEELDFLVSAVQKDKTVLGARMMGGGFGGCTINLIKKGTEDELIDRISKLYYNQFGIELKAYKVKIAQGTNQYKS